MSLRRALTWVARGAAVLVMAAVLSIVSQFGPAAAGPNESGGSTAGNGDLLSFLSQYGPLGVITALLIWFARGAYQRERDKVDKLEEDNKRLNSILLERVIPVLAAATQAAEQSAEQLRIVQRERERAALLEEQQRTAKGGKP